MEKEQIIKGLEWKKRIAAQIGDVIFSYEETKALYALIRELTEENERLKNERLKNAPACFQINVDGDVFEKNLQCLVQDMIAKQIIDAVRCAVRDVITCITDEVVHRTMDVATANTLLGICDALRKKYGVTYDGHTDLQS